MIKSMTGYGSAKGEAGGLRFTVELKSVNNRYLDISVRMPRGLLFAEEMVKSAVQCSISRGKIDVFISIDSTENADTIIRINESLASGYFKAAADLSSRYGVENDLTAVSLARFPDVLSVEKSEPDKDSLLSELQAIVENALLDFDDMRIREGEKLKLDLVEKMDNISALLAVVEEKAPETLLNYRNRLQQKLDELLSDRNIAEDRILAECAIFADKIAVDEETVRLRSHLSQFHQMLQAGSPIGRKMDFLIQEFNREANTIGSKCQNSEIAHTVVELKSEIEKAREQIQNVEWTLMKFISIGFGNFVSVEKIMTIVSPESAPIKRVIADAKEKGLLIDASFGRSTKAVLIMTSGHVILSALVPAVLSERIDPSSIVKEELNND